MTPPTKARVRPHASVLLDQAPTGLQLKVTAVEGEPDVARLLAQLQVRVGAVLRVVRAAPLGGPLLVECGGGTVIISRRLAERVRVQVMP